MSISIEVSSSDWVDLRTRGFSGTMYLLNAVGAPLEYSIAASPAAGAYLTGSAGVSIPGPYLWIRGAGTAELFTPTEWAMYNTKTYPVTAIPSESGRAYLAGGVDVTNELTAGGSGGISPDAVQDLTLRSVTDRMADNSRLRIESYQKQENPGNDNKGGGSHLAGPGRSTS